MPHADKKRLVEKLRREGYLRSPGVVKAFMEVRREDFIPPGARDHAYADQPLPIGRGQTISAPHMVAVMTELLEPDAKDRVLEVGAGSGYQAAVLSKLVKKVYAIELEPELSEFARANLKSAGIGNVEVICGDGSRGYPRAKPYEKIIVTCACPEIPEPLVEQLKEGGILLAPVGGGFSQTLVKGKKEKGKLRTRGILECVFVPLRH
jgi:protein-L-isoaspartate(D-aspartate) O-methyltransferase